MVRRDCKSIRWPRAVPRQAAESVQLSGRDPTVRAPGLETQDGGVDEKGAK